ncbi:MAG TPA: hypothetical protein VGK90_02615 [Rhizomicrobium sp.]|jgi:hypothetical protein
MPDDAAEADTLDNRGCGTAPGTLQAEPLITVPLSTVHRTQDFKCSNSERVTNFFVREAPPLIAGKYCNVFIAPDPSDETAIWGYYTLSAAQILRAHLSGKDEKNAVRHYLGLPPPMARIGFMGRHDSAPKGFGRGLLIDAARRVYRNQDIPAWGLVLESEQGEANAKLWKWYQDQGFKKSRDKDSLNTMYAPLSAFIPEFHSPK